MAVGEELATRGTRNRVSMRSSCRSQYVSLSISDSLRDFEALMQMSSARPSRYRPHHFLCCGVSYASQEAATRSDGPYPSLSEHPHESFWKAAQPSSNPCWKRAQALSALDVDVWHQHWQGGRLPLYLCASLVFGSNIDGDLSSFSCLNDTLMELFTTEAQPTGDHARRGTI
jgi:hypothetical protein